MNAHLSAATLRKLFPDIEQLRIELVFNDPNGRFPPPSPQLLTMYSAARAFFRFACPCADCDGDFDLTDAVARVVATSTGPEGSGNAEGHMPCHGIRFRADALHQRSCEMQLDFQLHSESHRAA